MFRASPRARGFTLIELMVVFAIMALLVSLVPALFERMRESAQYRNTLRTMVSDMRSARYRAVSQGVETSFKVNLEQRSFGVDGQTVHDLPESLEIHVVVADTELGETAGIRFLPDGGATGGSVDVLRASGSGTRLRVDWLSGSVTQEPLSSER